MKWISKNPEVDGWYWWRMSIDHPWELLYIDVGTGISRDQYGKTVLTADDMPLGQWSSEPFAQPTEEE